MYVNATESNFLFLNNYEGIHQMKFTASLKPCIIFDLRAANAFDQEQYICQSQASRTGGPFAKK